MSGKRKKRKQQASKLDPYVDIIGKIPDVDVAKMAGASRERVRQVRNKLGIAMTYELSPDRRGLYGRNLRKNNFDAVCAEASKERATAVGVAERVGLSEGCVYKHLGAAGIKLLRRDMIFWTDEMLGLLGKISDAKFAEQFGVASMTVKRKRRALGIPMLVDRRRKHHANEDAHHGAQHDTRGERGHAAADPAEPGDAL